MEAKASSGVRGSQTPGSSLGTRLRGGQEVMLGSSTLTQETEYSEKAVTRVNHAGRKERPSDWGHMFDGASLRGGGGGRGWGWGTDADFQVCSS